jgi:hypothetical protein
LLEEHDVDQFWCQFVEPTSPPPKEPDEGVEDRSGAESLHAPHRFSLIWKKQPDEEDLEWPVDDADSGSVTR